MESVAKIATILLLAGSLTAMAAPQSAQNPDDLDAPNTAANKLNSLNTDAVSIDVAFPSGGSALGTNSVGARFFLSPTTALGLHLQYSYDQEQNFLAFGATFRTQWFLASKGRSAFYSFAQLSGGSTKNTAPTTSATTNIVDKSSTQTGGAGGFGLEVFLLPELSASADVGVGAVFSPSDRTKISTATSQIALHFFFP